MKRTLSIMLHDKDVIIKDFDRFSIIELLGIAKHIEIAVTMADVQSLRNGIEKAVADEQPAED